MKKLFIAFLSLFCCKGIAAQDSVKAFIAYKFTLPGSSIKCKMIPIEQGNFLMGSSETDNNRKPDEGPQHRISISAFWMGVYEVSRDEFDVFYKDETTSENSAVDAVTRPSPQYIDFSGGMGKEGGYPVNSLSQFAAMMYCRWLYVKTGVFYRLPTEAEWEYACKAGSTTKYYFGNDEKQLDNYAWYEKNSGGKFQKAGQKLPNAWGLYDMLGNVCEWTLDHYDPKRLETLPEGVADPVVTPNPSKYPKVLKGGGYADKADLLRCATRFKSDAVWNRRDPQIPKSKWWLTDALSVGFRIICPLDQPTAAQAMEFYKAYTVR